MSTHTPGPWEIYRRDYRSDGLVLRQQGEKGKYLFALVEQPGIRESEANARLIAAAPDMLAVANRIALWPARKRPAMLALQEAARAAIAKAEGTS